MNAAVAECFDAVSTICNVENFLSEPGWNLATLFWGKIKSTFGLGHSFGRFLFLPTQVKLGSAVFFGKLDCIDDDIISGGRVNG